jgi:hypothetical protein
MPDDNATLGAAAASGLDADTFIGERMMGAGPRSRRSARRVLQQAWRMLRSEPLVHFALLGGLIFATDAVLHPPAKNERVITVTKALRQSFIDNYDEDKERVPSEAELQNMISNWVAAEILFREGKALGLDRGDEMIHDRVAYKLQLLIFDQSQAPKPTDEQLRAWFEANRARFDEPARIGFYLTAATDEATARQQLADIRDGREAADLRAKTRAILARPVPSLAASFGDAFSAALLALPLNEWSVLQSNEGWHVVRVDSRRDGKPVTFEEVRDEAARLQQTEETRKRAWDAVTRLKASYEVRTEQ